MIVYGLGLLGAQIPGFHIPLFGADILVTETAPLWQDGGVALMLYGLLAMIQKHGLLNLLLGITAFLVASLSAGYAVAEYIAGDQVPGWYDPVNAAATVVIAVVGVATSRHLWRP